VAKPRCQARLGTSRGARRHNKDVVVTELGHGLIRGPSVGARPERVRAAKRDRIRPPTRRSKVVGDSLDSGVEVGHPHRPEEAPVGAEQVVEELVPLVALGIERRIGIEHEDAAEAHPGRRGSRQSSVVALKTARGDERVGTRRDGVGDEQFELPRLVAARREPREVFTLQPQPPRCEAEGSGEAIGWLERRREVREHPAG
jgi:hypothetical protein